MLNCRFPVKLQKSLSFNKPIFIEIIVFKQICHSVILYFSAIYAHRIDKFNTLVLTHFAIYAELIKNAPKHHISLLR